MDFNISDYEESVFNAEEKYGNGEYAYPGELLERWSNKLLWTWRFMIYSLALLEQVYESSPAYRNCMRIAFKIKTENKSGVL